MVVQTVNKVCKLKCITVLFFYSKWEVTMCSLIQRKGCVDDIYIKYNGFLLFSVLKHRGLTLGKATFCGLQSLADNSPSYSMFPSGVYKYCTI